MTSPVYAGVRAVRLGIPSGTPNAATYSSIRQNLTLPATSSAITLTYMQRPGGGGDGYDYREAILFDGSGRPRTLERVYTGGSNVWQARTVDLTPYRGQNVVLYFNVYNNGYGGVTWNYLDQISVCAAP